MHALAALSLGVDMFAIFQRAMKIGALSCCISISQSANADTSPKIYYDSQKEIISIVDPSTGDKIVANEISVWFKSEYNQGTVSSVTEDIGGVVVGVIEPLRCVFIRFNPPVSKHSELDKIVKLISKNPLVERAAPVGSEPLVLE